MSEAALLEVNDLAVSFGGVRAVDGVSFDVAAGTLHGLIGPNGAGKTTTLDALTGFVPYDGRVEFEGHNLDQRAPHERAAAGLVRTFQSLELFDDLTVRENCLVAGTDAPLHDLGLADLADRLPRELSLGHRKLVALARALAAEPRLVLLDEPAAGLDSDESAQLAERLRVVVAGGVTILLIDHDMGLVLGVCDRVTVLDFGRVLASGRPDEIRTDTKVIDAYLGAATGPGGVGVTRALEARRVSAGYDGVAVVRGLDLHVDAGEVVALLGPNGAGKTTTLLTISGLLPVLAGELEVLGAPPSTRRPHTTAQRGVGHVPEDRSIFFDLTVRENLRLGGCRDEAQLGEVFELFPALEPLLDRKAGLCSGGEQQMLALGRALAAKPRLLLVDELSLGLAPIVVERLAPVLRRVADERGTAVLLVEQHVSTALDVADRAYVLQHGRVSVEGHAADLARQRDVLAISYLGESGAAPTS